MVARYQNVVVVGGSISGLMAGLTLESAGSNVIVLERIAEDAFRGQGAGLAIRPEVGEFIDTYKSKDVSMDHFDGQDTIVLNQDNSVAGVTPWPKTMFSTSWLSLATALRKSLLNDVKFAAVVTGITQAGDSLTVEYQQDGQPHSIENIDLVIGADGARSTVRRLMGQDPPRNYLGYCLWRGTTSIDALSPESSSYFKANKNMWSVNNHSNLLLYRTGMDQVMWAIYRNHTHDELKDILLDIHGHQHNYYMTSGMRPEHVKSIKDWSRTYFPSHLHECVEQSETASIQAITECDSSSNSFLGGKVLLVGEASTLPRPHVVAGTVHAAYHAMRLKDLAEGTIDVEEWSRNTKAFSTVLKESSEEQGKIWTEMEGNFEVVMASRMALVEMSKKLGAVEQDVRRISA